MNDYSTFRSLAFAGALPFIACAVALVSGISTLAPFGGLDTLAGSYGLAILSFLAGTHWAIHLLRPSETPYNLFVVSNVVFLIVWFAWILGPLSFALSIQIVAFGYLLLVDYRLNAAGVTTSGYFRVRAAATVAAMLSLLTIVVAR